MDHGQAGRCWWADARPVKGDSVPLRDLIVAWEQESAVVEAGEGTIADYRTVTAEVLPLCGTGAPPLFTGTLGALENVLPRATRVELPGLNHCGPQDQGGIPAIVATTCAASSPRAPDHVSPDLPMTDGRRLAGK